MVSCNGIWGIFGLSVFIFCMVNWLNRLDWSGVVIGVVLRIMCMWKCCSVVVWCVW